MPREQQREFFETYRDDVFRMCMYMVKKREDAEDLTQEIFLIVFRQDMSGITSVKPWLMTIAVNTCRNHFKKNNRLKQNVRTLFHIFGSSSKEEQKTRIVEEAVIAGEDAMEWEYWLNELPLKYREVLVLRYVSELSQFEISETLNIPVGTVKSRMNRGLKLLKEVVEKKSVQQVVHFPKEELI